MASFPHRKSAGLPCRGNRFTRKWGRPQMPLPFVMCLGLLVNIPSLSKDEEIKPIFGSTCSTIKRFWSIFGSLGGNDCSFFTKLLYQKDFKQNRNFKRWQCKEDKYQRTRGGI
ncbi:hypothetical protein V8G54_010493 [Vigna mungo]|uniref:Uncharacterized protein n=1 Tax=Vigna mungo TaxID=3915 RepID=A0AAQ3NYL6_VIGMU